MTRVSHADGIGSDDGERSQDKRRWCAGDRRGKAAFVSEVDSSSAAQRPDVLSVVVQEAGESASLRLSGDLDLSSAPQFERALAQVLATPRRQLTIDLQELSFVDSSGLRAILAAQRECEGASCALTLIAGEQARRLFDLTGVSESLPLAAAPRADGTARV
jgi:anti-anti-sigma factor